MSTSTLQLNKNPWWAQNKPKISGGAQRQINPAELEEKPTQDGNNAKFAEDQRQKAIQETYDDWNKFLGVDKLESLQAENKSEESKIELEIGGVTQISFEKKSTESVETQVEVTAEFETKIKKPETRHNGVDNISFIKEAVAEMISPKNITQAAENTYKFGKDFSLAIWDLWIKDIWGGEGQKGSGKNGKDGKEQKQEEKKPNFLLENMAWIYRSFVSLDKLLFLNKQRQDVNKRIRFSNTSYEGSVTADGQVRIDLLAALDKANSELSKEELKKKKQLQIKKATGKKDLSLNLNAQEGNSKVANQIMSAG